ncbi:MAG: hypothetical protein IPM79_38585 [Polyangiaceae bacterium]|jgi:hypothetical protein|nr:hypothetical protein [Polyangiaceae bacterium]MBK8943357.1 hypothetical protein [Polyangiaceae bacterium]
MSDVVLSVIATRDVRDVTVGRVMQRARALVASSLGLEPSSLSLQYGLGALTDAGLTRSLEPASPLEWHDDLEVLEVDLVLSGRTAATLSVRHGLLDWDQLLPVPLEPSLAAVVGPALARRALELDTAWWLDAHLDRPEAAALARALMCAIAEPCDGILCESTDDRVFGSAAAFVAAWPSIARL